MQNAEKMKKKYLVQDKEFDYQKKEKGEKFEFDHYQKKDFFHLDEHEIKQALCQS